MLGASAGLAAYRLIALRSDRHRAALRTFRSGTTRGHVMAASFISIGQLAPFAAIGHIEVSRVVMITSAEIFIAPFLSVHVLKTERRPDPATLAAAVIAMAGVVPIATPRRPLEA